MQHWEFLLCRSTYIFSVFRCCNIFVLTCFRYSFRKSGPPSDFHQWQAYIRMWIMGMMMTWSIFWYVYVCLWAYFFFSFCILVHHLFWRLCLYAYHEKFSWEFINCTNSGDAQCWSLVSRVWHLAGSYLRGNFIATWTL